MNTDREVQWHAEQTKSGLPARWFGRFCFPAPFTPRGYATLITGPDGERLRPCYVNEEADRLVAIAKDYLEIEADTSPSFNGDGFQVVVRRVASIDRDTHAVSLELVAYWDGRRWHGRLTEQQLQAVQATRMRAGGSDLTYWILRKSDLLSENL